MAELILVSPMEGWAAPLDEVPDPVFAERMLGDGLAIDPVVGELRAPCAGTVVQLHAARHALTLRTDGGSEVLMHVGLETVALGGEGFTAHVAEGQRVEAGALLLSFDLDLVARRARSLITPIVILGAGAEAFAARTLDQPVAFGAPLMRLRLRLAGAGGEDAGAAPEAMRSLRTPLAHGFHARPAARIAALAKTFQARLEVAALGRRVSAASPIALMGLGVRLGDVVELSAAGPDAEAAVEALAGLIAGGMGEAARLPDAAAPATRAEPAAAAPEQAPEQPLDQPPGTLKGVTAAPGLAIGVAARLVAPEITVEPRGGGLALESQALAAALAAVRARLEQAAGAGGQAQRSILAAHLALLEDPELAAAAERSIGEGSSAAYAWRAAVQAQAEVLRRTGDPRLIERVDDLVDLERRVLLALKGEAEGPPPLPSGAILLADDLLASQLIALDAGRLAGLCTARGGPTSHVAILAASMNLPALVAAGPGVSAIGEGTPLVLDADAGLLRVAPPPAELMAAETRLAARKARRVAAQAAARQDGRMADGTRIEVFANLASLAAARAAVEAGAEGCGLLRTEFLFQDRSTPPSEDEQLDSYQAIAEALDGRPLIIRTLDAGGDKPVDYLPIPPEDNPALGLRGVRAGLWRPELLRAQLRAILRAGRPGQCRIMIPMVASLDELRAVRAMVEAARAELGRAEPIEVGVMIETPAAAVTADLIAAEADFLSVGSNDLAQYALAMDRGNPLLAARVDSLHPAVLRLIGAAAAGGAAHGRTVGVCGGLASDLAAAPILIGLGVTELSATPAAVPELKALIRTLTMEGCRALAERAKALASAAEVRALAHPDDPTAPADALRKEAGA